MNETVFVSGGQQVPVRSRGAAHANRLLMARCDAGQAWGAIGGDARIRHALPFREAADSLLLA